jgi:N-acyl-D-aspartate/D-glutamate deacylase
MMGTSGMPALPANADATPPASLGQRWPNPGTLYESSGKLSTSTEGLLMLDTIIRGATVYDGTGRPPLQRDVGVKNGVIVEVASTRESAIRTVDASGLTLMPGIVDLHTHFDAQVTWDPTLSPSGALGVTTAVMGNCGFGIAPCPAPLRDTMLRNLSVVEGMNLESLRAGVRWEFETFAQYMEQLRRLGPYLNVAVFAGHSVIRTAVLGKDASEQAEPNASQLAAMREEVRAALRAGAIGFASSFSPNHSGYGGRPMPSTIASEDELRALTAVLGEERTGVFMMATGSRATPDIMESIVADCGRPGFISTVLAMYNEARPELGLSYYERAAQALARGNELYMLTSCQPLSFDFTLLDPYVLLSFPAFERVKRAQAHELAGIYQDPGFRSQFRSDLRTPRTGTLFLGNWRHIEVGETALVEHRRWEGASIAELAQAQHRDPVDVFFDLALAEELQTHFIGKFFQNVDEGVAPLVRHPAGVITLSDAGAHLGYMCDAGFGLHFLAHWVRDKKLFSWEEGIKRLTSEPADRFRIPGRGRLQAGASADFLLIDPDKVGISPPMLRHDLPGGAARRVREPLGVHGVWVNGTMVHDGQDYVALSRGPGQVLDRFNP